MSLESRLCSPNDRIVVIMLIDIEFSPRITILTPLNKNLIHWWYVDGLSFHGSMVDLQKSCM